MKRLFIEGFSDGNIAVDTQSLIANHKITGDKRKCELQPKSWQRIERTIVRPGKVVPESVAHVFGAAGGATVQARANDATAAFYKLYAEIEVEEIERHNAAFEIKPAKRVRVIIEEVSDDAAL